MTWFLLGAITNARNFFDKRNGVQESARREPQKRSGFELLRLHARDLGIRRDESQSLIQRALAEEPYNGAYRTA